jgi:hypothetical protein
MKTLYILFFLVFSSLFLMGQSPELIVKYNFQDNLTDSKANSTLYTFGTGNDGNNHNNSSTEFNSDANGSYWHWESTLARGGAFWIDLDEDISTNYSIGIRFSFENTETSYRKIIDFKDMTSDYGLYFYSGGKLTFYPLGTLGTSVTQNDEIVDLIITRDGTTSKVNVYIVVDNVLYTELSDIDDASSRAVPSLVDGKPRFHFFHDDNGTTSEATPSGKVYSLKIWDGPISSSDIEDAMDVSWTGATNTNWNNAGNWSTNSIPTIDNDIEIVNVSNQPIIASGTNAEAKNIDINNSSTITISDGGCLTVAENITNNGNININSSSSGEGSLIVNGSLSGSGTYNVERYLSGSQWHLVSSPITAGTSGVFEDIWLRPYNESTNTFGDYITPTTTPMPTGQGFSVWADANETRTFTGTINHGTVGPLSVQLTGAAGENTGWNLMGNPYPSAIDWNAASGWTKINLNNSVYVWNSTVYASFVAGVGNNGGSRYIAPGQGFFVQANAASASLTMTNDVRVHNSVNFLKETSDPDNVIRIQLSANGYSDETVIAIREADSYAFDPMADAWKLTGSSDAPQMYILKDDLSDLSIASFNDLMDIEGKALYMNYAQDGQHSISWSHTLTTAHTPVLFDQMTGNIITEGTNYQFDASNSDMPERFIFTQNPVGIQDNISTLNVWEYNNILFVNNSNMNDNQVQIFNIQGVKIFKGTGNEFDLNHLAPAMYIVKVKSGEHAKTQKIVIK